MIDTHASRGVVAAMDSLVSEIFYLQICIVSPQKNKKKKQESFENQKVITSIRSCHVG